MYKCLYEVAQKTDSLSLLNIRNQNEQIFKLTCFDSPPSNSQKYCVWCKKLSSWVSVVQIRRFPLVVRPAVFRTVLRRQKAISTRRTFISKWHNQAAFLPLVGLKKKEKPLPRAPLPPYTNARGGLVARSFTRCQWVMDRKSARPCARVGGPKMPRERYFVVLSVVLHNAQI